MAQGKHLAPKGRLAAKTEKTAQNGARVKSGTKRNTSARNILLLVLIGILFVCIIGIAAVLLFARSKINKLKYVPTEIDKETGKAVVEIREEIPEEATQESEGNETMENTLVEEEVELPEGEVREDQNILNIMLVGTDFKSKTWDDPGRADVTMLCSLNKKEGTIKLISFERGIMVPIPGKGSDLLTHSYVWGGMNLLLQDLQDCFLLNIDGYMHVDFDSFQEVIEAVGGVDIEISEGEAWALNRVSGPTFTLREGVNHMDGPTALAFCRLRYIDDNFGRNQRQRRTIQALMEKAKGMSVKELNAMSDKVLPLIETNIETKTFMSLLSSAPKFLKLDAEQVQVPEGLDSSKINFSYEADRLKTIIYGE